MATISKATSKVAGMAKGASEAMAGYPGIFHHLAGEHAEVASLIDRVAESDDDSSVREELFPEIRKSLLAHAHGEEQEFYPKLKQYPELESLIKQSKEEHKEIESYLDELASGDKNTESWRMRFEQFAAAVESHVDLEENQLFPKATELVSSDQADDMLDRYEEVEEREKAQMQG